MSPANTGTIRIRGARQNNLKGIDVEIRCRQPGLIPVVGIGRVSSLEALLASRSPALSPRHMETLEAMSAVAPGFPHDFLQRESVGQAIHGDAFGRITFPPVRALP